MNSKSRQKLKLHPLIWKNTLQSFLARIAIIADGQRELAEWHTYFTRRGIWDDRPCREKK